MMTVCFFTVSHKGSISERHAVSFLVLAKMYWVLHFSEKLHNLMQTPQERSFLFFIPPQKYFGLFGIAKPGTISNGYTSVKRLHSFTTGMEGPKAEETKGKSF